MVLIPFQPTTGETVGNILGFSSKRVTDFNRVSRIASQAETQSRINEDSFNQQQAEEVVKGNFGNVRLTILQRAKEDKTYDPVSAVRAVAGASEALTFPRDLRREGTLRLGDTQARLLAALNVPTTQPSEMDRFRFRQSVEQRLGLTSPSPTGLQTAQVMDELRRQNPTASRAELRRQTSLLLRGRRQQTLALPPE